MIRNLCGNYLLEKVPITGTCSKTLGKNLTLRSDHKDDMAQWVSAFSEALKASSSSVCFDYLQTFNLKIDIFSLHEVG